MKIWPADWCVRRWDVGGLIKSGWVLGNEQLESGWTCHYPTLLRNDSQHVRSFTNIPVGFVAARVFCSTAVAWSTAGRYHETSEWGALDVWPNVDLKKALNWTCGWLWWVTWNTWFPFRSLGWSILHWHVWDEWLFVVRVEHSPLSNQSSHVSMMSARQSSLRTWFHMAGCSRK